MVTKDMADRIVIARQLPAGEFLNPTDAQLSLQIEIPEEPIPMVLACPICGSRHIDEGEFATKPHHTHACQECGLVWRPALVPTVGVQFLPGFKNEPTKPAKK